MGFLACTRKQGKPSLKTKALIELIGSLRLISRAAAHYIWRTARALDDIFNAL